jgi:hypothetical protein
MSSNCWLVMTLASRRNSSSYTKLLAAHLVAFGVPLHTVLTVRNDLLVIAVLKLSDILSGKAGRSGTVFCIVSRCD